MATKKRPLPYQATSDNREENFIIYLRRGNNLSVSARASSFPIRSYYNKVEAAERGDPEAKEFIEKVEAARAQAVAEHLQVLRNAALGGDWRASVEWLKANQRDEWGNDVKVTVEHKVSEQLEMLFQRIQQLLPEPIYVELMEGLRVQNFLSEMNSSEVQDAELIEAAKNNSNDEEG